VQVVHKLSAAAPPKILVENYMVEIARTYKVPFEPDPLVMMVSVSVGVVRCSCFHIADGLCHLFKLHYDYFAPGMGVKYCDQYVCLSVRSHNSKTTWMIFTKFFCMSPVAMARSSSDGVVIC